MTRVLLIADTERVQRIFEALEEKGVLHLQAAATLAQGEVEIAASPADFTFVQSRISGFSGEILVRHLDKILPTGAQLVLLAGDAEEAAHAKRHGKRSLDLSADDDVLEQAAIALLTGAAMPAGATGHAPPLVKAAPAKAKMTTPSPDLAEEQESEPVQPEHGADLAEQEADGSDVEGSPPSPSLHAAGKAASAPFEEVMRFASANVKPGMLEIEDRVELGKDFPGAEETSEPDGEGVGPASMGAFVAGESLADAMRRADMKTPRRPYRIIVPVLVLISIALFFNLFIGGPTPDPKTASLSRPEPVRTAPPGLGTGTGVVPPAAAPEAEQPAGPANGVETGREPITAPLAKPEGKAEVKPVAKQGLSALPPFLEGVRLDADYGKTHPGWVRYVGKRAEYKLFKEAELYKAMQVMALGGGTISDHLFKRVVSEFGGIDKHRVESSDAKGNYLVEQCVTDGSAALTIYRNKKDSKIKALVVYYR